VASGTPTRPRPATSDAERTVTGVKTELPTTTRKGSTAAPYSCPQITRNASFDVNLGELFQLQSGLRRQF